MADIVEASGREGYILLKVAESEKIYQICVSRWRERWKSNDGDNDGQQPKS